MTNINPLESNAIIPDLPSMPINTQPPLNSLEQSIPSLAQDVPPIKSIQVEHTSDESVKTQKAVSPLFKKELKEAADARLIRKTATYMKGSLHEDHPYVMQTLSGDMKSVNAVSKQIPAAYIPLDDIEKEMETLKSANNAPLLRHQRPVLWSGTTDLNGHAYILPKQSSGQVLNEFVAELNKDLAAQKNNPNISKKYLLDYFNSKKEQYKDKNEVIDFINFKIKNLNITDAELASGYKKYYDKDDLISRLNLLIGSGKSEYVPLLKSLKDQKEPFISEEMVNSLAKDLTENVTKNSQKYVLSTEIKALNPEVNALGTIIDKAHFGEHLSIKLAIDTKREELHKDLLEPFGITSVLAKHAFDSPVRIGEVEAKKATASVWEQEGSNPFDQSGGGSVFTELGRVRLENQNNPSEKNRLIYESAKNGVMAKTLLGECVNNFKSQVEEEFYKLKKEEIDQTIKQMILETINDEKINEAVANINEAGNTLALNDLKAYLRNDLDIKMDDNTASLFMAESDKATFLKNFIKDDLKKFEETGQSPFKQQVIETLMQKESTFIEKTLIPGILTSKKEVNNGIISLGELLLTDILFTAGDSHHKQFIRRDNGEYVSIDWSRFLPPHFSYRSDNIVVPNIRIALLDHPLAEVPIAENSPYGAPLLPLKERVLSWNIDNIVKSWEKQDLIGTEEFFQEKEIELTALEARGLKAKGGHLTTEERAKLCEDMGVDKSIETKDLIKVVLNKMGEIRQETMGKIDPKAVEEFKTRAKALQEYFKTDNPTLEGAFLAFNPESAPFYLVMKKLNTVPGNNLSVKEGNIRSFDEIISEAKTNNQITNEEIDNMVKMKTKIEKEASTQHRFGLTSGGVN